MNATDYPWPAQRRAALCVTFDLDGEAPHLWRTRDRRPPGVAELEQRRYGPTRGVQHLLAMLRRLSVRSTFFVPGWIARTYPEAVRQVHDDGHEVALHGWLHEPPTDLTREDLLRTLERSVQQLRAVTGERPVGYRSPSWQMTPQTFDVLRELGLTYDSSLMSDDRPFTLEGLVEVPVDWATDDAPYYRYTAGDARPPALPLELTAAWRHEIEAARRLGTLCMLTMHPFLSGRPARLTALEDALDEILPADDLYVGRVDELAAHHAARDSRQPRPRSLAWPTEEELS